MDDYLDEETDFVKACFEETCRAWETQVCIFVSCCNLFLIPFHQLLQHSGPTVLGLQNGTEVTQVRFIGSSNPAQVKRNVLASFADVLLLPVTIVPRTAASVGKAVAAGGSAAVQGIAMLNPQKWGASSANGAGASESGFGKRFSKLGSWRQSRGGSVDHSKNGYTRDFEKSMETDKSTLFEIGDVDEDEGAERNDILANGEEMDMETEKTDQCKCMHWPPEHLMLKFPIRVRIFEYHSLLHPSTLHLIYGYVFDLSDHARVCPFERYHDDDVRQAGPPPLARCCARADSR